MTTTSLHIVHQSELKVFMESKQYRDFHDKPLSAARLISYINNPHARPDDKVLYLLLQNDQPIAYRSILPDDLYGKTTEHFGWCSGNWVHPAFRRQGYSHRLLNQALKDWNDKLMYTNYAPESHALYQKTGKFKQISYKKGNGFYLYARTQKLLKNRIKRAGRIFLPLIDVFIYLAAALKAILTNAGTNRWALEVKKSPDDVFYRLFDERRKVCFERTSKDLAWILKYPWVKEGDDKQAYFFSHRAKRFFYRFIIMRHDGEIQGFAMLQYRDGLLKVPYFQVGSGGHTELANFLVKFCKKHRVKQLIVFDPVLSEAIAMTKNPFIYKKEKTQKVFAAWDTSCQYPVMADGDGDYVFT